MINLRKNDALADAVKEILQQEALKGNQTKIDKNHNGKIDGQDFTILRGQKKTVKEEETVEEGIKDVAKKAFKALTGGSDEDQRKDLQRKMGVPQTGKKPEPKNEEVESVDEIVKIFHHTADGASLSRSAKDPSNPAAVAHRKAGADAARAARAGGNFKFKGDAKATPLTPKSSGGHVQAVKAEEVQGKTLRQFMENAFDYKSPRKPEPNGGSGMKQGSRYGGSKQKDKPEQDTDTKK